MSNIPVHRINPLRYPGGKRWFAPYIERIINNNGLRSSLFVEPFAGGAGVSLYLLYTNKVESIGLADLDPLLSSFWKVVFSDVNNLLGKIEDTAITIDEWNYQKNNMFSSIEDKAFQCLFLNRTSFSGILEKKAGPIGGRNQNSKYPIDCRFNKKAIIETILYLNKAYSDRVLFVWNKSWKYTLNRLSNEIQTKGLNGNKLLLYFDPPFIRQGESLYRCYFKKNHHIELRDALAECELPWILSYDDCEESRDLYRTIGHGSLDVLYCSSKTSKKGNTKAKSELIVSNLKNTISEILPSAQNRKRIAANSRRNDLGTESKEKTCQFNIPTLQTGIR
ncbi:MAG: DNA adenine methylase [Thiolinea sp.]